MDSAFWLPVVFAGLMGLAILLYVVLDGYDLGVGLLVPFADDDEKDQMIASIGPFWDANETWLVLGIGLLLVAFPVAHGIILSSLYLPTALLLTGLILRGVSFDFRAKVADHRKRLWNRLFFFGSLLAALSQGYMLGSYIMGFAWTLPAVAFSLLTALCLAAGYGYLGAAWLVLKTEDVLQRKAVRWARRTLVLTALGIAAVSLGTPLASPRIFERWFSMPEFFLLLPLPITAAVVAFGAWWKLGRLPMDGDRWAWVPLAAGVVLFLICFHGLAYSFYPYLIPDSLDIWQAASAPESLMIILVGTLFVLPCILGYTVYAYKVFWGKVRALRYY